MLDRRGENLARLVQVAAGKEHTIDLGAVLGPLLDLVEVAVVRDQRLASLFGEPARAHSGWVVLWRQIGHVDREEKVCIAVSDKNEERRPCEKRDRLRPAPPVTASATVPAVRPKGWAAAMIGTLIKGFGTDHVVWGTDSVWYGSPQWQIEAMRRLEIPEDMQKKYGFAPLGGANGPVKQAIFGLNSARLYRINLKAADAQPLPAYSADRLAQLKKEYEFAAKEPSNLRYGYVRAG
jgi:hypothetical protein